MRSLLSFQTSVIFKPKEKLEAEIIIVDGQSSDRTKEIAKNLTDKVYDV